MSSCRKSETILEHDPADIIKENIVNKRQLRKALRRAINEARYGDNRKLGYGSGSIVADMSDEIMEIVRYCLENGMSEEEIKIRGHAAIEAGILEFRRVRR